MSGESNLVRERWDLLLGSRSRVDLLREQDAWYTSTRFSSSLPYLGVLLCLSLASGDVRGSLRSKEANAEGDARDRLDFDRKSGDGEGLVPSSSVALE